MDTKVSDWTEIKSWKVSKSWKQEVYDKQIFQNITESENTEIQTRDMKLTQKPKN